MSIKEAYYYLYYRIYKVWNKSCNPILSADWRADVSIMLLQVWLVMTLFAYYSIITGIKTKLSLTNPMGLIPIILSLGLTFYFFTFSSKKKLYFAEFEQWSKAKNQRGGLIVWGIVIFIFINLFVSVELMKKLNG